MRMIGFSWRAITGLAPMLPGPPATDFICYHRVMMPSSSACSDLASEGEAMSAVVHHQAEAPLILAIDAGTSSVRALLFDRQGRSIEGLVAQEQYSVQTGADGTVQSDPAAMLDRVGRCIDQVLQQAGDLAGQIAGVAVDTLATTMMALDGDGHPLTPLITYADTRNEPDSLTLRRRLDESAVHQRTGCLLRTSYWPARLAWLRRTQPQVWQSAARFVTLGEYLEQQLFGQCRVSFSIASWSGLLDRRTLGWDQPLLDELGLGSDRLSALIDVDAPLHGLSGAFAARWPVLRTVPWFPAVGDGAVANIGSGCTSHERMALTIGTSGAVRMVAGQIDQIARGLWCYRVDRQHALLGGATSE